MILLNSNLTINELQNVGIILGVVLIAIAFLILILDKEKNEARCFFATFFILGFILLIFGIVMKG